jgi:ADP-ribosyl-[dinitrogen reductase] hydrolase
VSAPARPPAGGAPSLAEVVAQQPGSPVSGPDLASRARGAYLGLAVGDALGGPVEFMTAGEIRKVHGELRDMVGGGWLRLKPGQVTDDTQMSLALGAAIVAAGGWDLRAIADAWVRWLRSRPIDIGNTCRRGLQRYLAEGTLAKPAHEGDAGNGALMRNLPTVLYAWRDADRLEALSLQQAHVTHHHPLSDAAVLAFARISAALLAGGGLAAAREHADALVARHRVFRFDPYPQRSSGYVVDTVQTVLHALFSTASFEACVVRAVNLGGDADTNAAIAGWLAGAAYGEATIPQRWLRKIERRVRDEIVGQAAALTALGANR